MPNFYFSKGEKVNVIGCGKGVIYNLGRLSFEIDFGSKGIKLVPKEKVYPKDYTFERLYEGINIYKNGEWIDFCEY